MATASGIEVDSYIKPESVWQDLCDRWTELTHSLSLPMEAGLSQEWITVREREGEVKV